MRVDLQHDVDLHAGHALLEQLVGAHMAAQNEEELFHLVNMAFTGVFDGDLHKRIRLAIHSAYHAQALIIKLLTLSARQAMALEEAGVGPASAGIDESERLYAYRLDVWDQIRSLDGSGQIL